MLILDRSLAREMTGPFLIGVAAFTAILTGSQMLYQLAKLALQGVPFPSIVRLFLLGLPSFVVLTFPMSMLFSSLMSFGRLSGDSELVAIYSAGISLRRMMLPVLVLALGVCVLTWEFNETVVPWTSRTAASMKSDLGEQRTQNNLLLPIVRNDELELLVYARRFDPSRNLMSGVVFERFRNGQPVVLVSAPEAVSITDRIWSFRNATVWQAVDDGWRIIRLASARYDIGHTPEQIRASRIKPEQMTYRELDRHITEQERKGLRGPEVDQNRVELQRKAALPFTSLVFAMIGVPLGIRPGRRAGGFGVGLGYSILIIFAFYVLTSYLLAVGGQGGLDPTLAAWLPNIITFTVGIVLLVRAPK